MYCNLIEIGHNYSFKKEKLYIFVFSLLKISVASGGLRSPDPASVIFGPKSLKIPNGQLEAVNRRRTQEKGQKHEQRSTKHYTENEKSSTTNPTE